MLGQWVNQFAPLRFLFDAVDILLVGFIIYWMIRLIQGTRAVYMLLGLAIAVGVFWLSNVLELYTLHWLLGHLFGSLLLIVVVVFQADLRRMLTRVGKAPIFSLLSKPKDQHMIEQVVKAAATLARHRTGALIVIERDAAVMDHLEEGVILDAELSKELLIAIFQPMSPIHDGAVVLQNAKVAAAGCFLPMASTQDIGKELGTRHRAAMSLSEETDALVVVVSEEKGWVSLALEGRILHGLSEEELRSVLWAQLQPSPLKKSIFPWIERKPHA